MIKISDIFLGGRKMTILVYIMAFLKNAIYGTSVFFTGKLTSSVDVLDLLASRFLLSFVAMWLLKVTKIIKVNVGIKEFSVKNMKNGAYTLLLAALFEPVLYMFFEALGISMSSGIMAGVIFSLMPIASCISESFILKEKTSTAQKIYLLLGIIGVIYIAAKTDVTSGKDSIFGIVCLVISIICGALFMVFSRKSSKKFNAMEVTYIYCLLGMLAFNLVNVVRHIFDGNLLNYFAPYFNVDNMIGFIFLSIISTIIATQMNNFALGRMQTSTMSAFGGVSTFTTVLIGVIFMNEKLYYYHYIGFALIIIRMIGVSYIAIKKDKEKV
jgi:drug/metabolite transporter (DMT)-like permease